MGGSGIGCNVLDVDDEWIKISFSNNNGTIGGKDMEIIGKEIDLLPYTIERCHEFWKDYVTDYDMWDQEYNYDEDSVNKYYQVKVMDENRKFFAICRKGKTIGEIQLKNIDFEDKHGTMSIHLSNDIHKNKGLGTEAEKLLINYAFECLKLNCIYADTVLRNKRSQHILEKLGFTKIDEDDVLIYYELKVAV